MVFPVGAKPADVNYIRLFGQRSGGGEEADAMRIATTLALAAIGVVAIVLPSAAQSPAVSEAPSRAPCQDHGRAAASRPAGIACPNATRADKAGREDMTPASATPQSAVVVPHDVVTQQIGPQEAAPQQAFAAPAQAVPPHGAELQPAYATPMQPDPVPQTSPPSGFSDDRQLLNWIPTTGIIPSSGRCLRPCTRCSTTASSPMKSSAGSESASSPAFSAPIRKTPRSHPPHVPHAS